MKMAVLAIAFSAVAFPGLAGKLIPDLPLPPLPKLESEEAIAERFRWEVWLCAMGREDGCDMFLPSAEKWKKLGMTPAHPWHDD